MARLETLNLDVTVRAITVEVAKLSLKPGDKLLVKIAGTLTAEQGHRLAAQIVDVIGDDIPVLVVDDDAEIAVLEGDR